MARAICDQCGKEFYWRGSRGARLANVKSPCCGSTASGKRGNPIRSPRLDMPKKRMMVAESWETAFLSPREPDAKIHWLDPKPRQVLFAHGGTFMLSGRWAARYVSKEVIIENGQQYRVFVDARSFDEKSRIGTLYYFRILESDFQALLATVVIKTAPTI